MHVPECWTGLLCCQVHTQRPQHQSSWIPNVVCCVQFGKVDAYTYIMDYNPSEITAIQAFAISLSTFDTKLLI